VKNTIKDAIKKSLDKTIENHNVGIDIIEINICKDKKFGDFSSNIAMKLASKLNYKPIELAKEIIKNIKKDESILKIEIAGPGFINFFTSDISKYSVIENIFKEKEDYGKNNLGKGLKILVEFVSANPTGPLHVGHGRGAAFGDCISNLLKENGYEVAREYYVNDAGKQIDILTISVLQRYHELINNNYKFSYNELYKGEYVWDIAAEIHRNFKTKFQIKALKDKKNNTIDEYISYTKDILTISKFEEIKKIAVDFILNDIKKTLNSVGITYSSWFLESSLLKNNSLKEIITNLEKENLTYTKDKALWFK